MKEWEKYKCDELPKSKFSLSQAIPLKEIYHVVHLDATYSILKDKKLRSGLIFDKSVLNKERILVNWVSPNYWHYGSRYGNVMFSFDFAELIKSKNIYWVEVIEYGIHAPRFLVTDKDYAGHRHLKPYDPKTDRGPWIERGGEHWWNPNITLEIMIEEDLRTRQIKEVSFTDHHTHQCKIDPKSCPDRGMTAGEARKRYFATILGMRILIKRDHYVKVNDDGDREAFDNLRDGVRSILADAREQSFGGTITKGDQSAAALMLSALTFLGQNEHSGFEDTLILFNTYEDFKAVLLEYVVCRFRLPDDSSLRRRFL